MSKSAPAGSRAGEAQIVQDAGEEMHHCGFCGTRTVEREWTDDNAILSECLNCKQRYRIEDGDDGYDLGEIEVVDEKTGAVTGMTKTLMPEASQADLNRLFGIKPEPVEPSPYGDIFGSF